MRRWACLMLSALLVYACQYPRDPDGTLNRIEDGGVMRVGVSESDPWVLLEGDEPSGGAEIELVRRFARDLGARIEWVQGSEEQLVEAIKEGQADLLIAGLSAKSRWKKDVALTRPYVETRTVVAVPPGGSAPDDFAGVPVAVELGDESLEQLAGAPAPADLAPTLSTRYRRITLAAVEGAQRVTLDLDVTLRTMDNRQVTLRDSLALVETKTEDGNSEFDTALVDAGCEPTGISKYRLGVGLLLAEDPAEAGQRAVRGSFG